MIRNILEYLEKTAKRLPDKIAFSGAEGTITFAELEETAKRIGTYLDTIRRQKLPNRGDDAENACFCGGISGCGLQRQFLYAH